jgi:hypothetical protein
MNICYTTLSFFNYNSAELKVSVAIGLATDKILVAT